MRAQSLSHDVCTAYSCARYASVSPPATHTCPAPPRGPRHRRPGHDASAAAGRVPPLRFGRTCAGAAAAAPVDLVRGWAVRAVPGRAGPGSGKAGQRGAGPGSAPRGCARRPAGSDRPGRNPSRPRSRGRPAGPGRRTRPGIRRGAARRWRQSRWRTCAPCMRKGLRDGEGGGGEERKRERGQRRCWR